MDIKLDTPLSHKRAKTHVIISANHNSTIHHRINQIINNTKFIASNRAVILLATARAKKNQDKSKSFTHSFLLISSSLSWLYFLIR